jgi:hypothetical protein
MNHFVAFNIIYVPRSLNSNADLLANVASKLIPSEDLLANKISVELIFNPFAQDNITNWRVFDDDDQIFNFPHPRGHV